MARLRDPVGTGHYGAAMQCRIRDVPVYYTQHGEGRPVLVLHGMGVDHREAQACFEPVLDGYGGLRRVYPDLPGMGRTPAPAALCSADDVLDVLLGLVDEVAGDEPVLVVGHSAGGYYGYGLAERRPDRVGGLALICPLLPGVRDLPEHRAVVAGGDLGDEGFRGYFVVQTPAMLQRYRRFVAPAIPLVDTAAMARIGERWQLRVPAVSAYRGPMLLVAGRQDSTVGYVAAVDLFERYPGATLAVLDAAGHALPHEQPELLAALLHELLVRADQTP